MVNMSKPVKIVATVAMVALCLLIGAGVIAGTVEKYFIGIVVFLGFTLGNMWRPSKPVE